MAIGLKGSAVCSVDPLLSPSLPSLGSWCSLSTRCCPDGLEFLVDETFDCELRTAAPSGSQGPQGRGEAAVVYSGLRSLEYE
jgi:hypothetical protein